MYVCVCVCYKVTNGWYGYKLCFLSFILINNYYNQQVVT